MGQLRWVLGILGFWTPLPQRLPLCSPLPQPWEEEGEERPSGSTRLDLLGYLMSVHGLTDPAVG